MYKLDLQIDPKEAASLEARRQREEERKARIFDAKQRTIGLDTQALQAQIQEKQQRKAAEQQWDKACEDEALRQAKVIELLEKRQKEDMKAMLQAEQEFRQQNQQKHQTREFDLNNPNFKKEARPVRETDDDENLGPSSLQKFAGEDLAYEARTAAQKEQNRAWIEQQKLLKQKQQEEEAYQKQLNELREQEVALRTREMMTAEEQARKAQIKATMEYNKAMAANNQRKKTEEKQRELEMNFAEMNATIRSDLMSENPAAAIPSNSDTRRKIVPDRYKGMSAEDKQSVLATQTAQAEEARRKKEEERLLKEEQDRLLLLQAKASTILQRQSDKARREQERLQAEENARLAQEHKDRQNTLRQTSRQQADEDFFAQFNKSTR